MTVADVLIVIALCIVLLPFSVMLAMLYWDFWRRVIARWREMR